MLAAEVQPMESTPAHLALYVLAIAFGEFVWQAWFEAWYPRSRLHSSKEYLRAYVVYRLFVFVSHALAIALLFRAPLSQILLTALVLTLLGCSELLFAAVSNWMYARTQRTIRPLHLIYVALLTSGIIALWTSYTWQPGVVLAFLNGLHLSETVRSRLLSDHAF